MPEKPMSAMRKPLRRDSTAMASATLCGSSGVGPMTTRETTFVTSRSSGASGSFSFTEAWLAPNTAIIRGWSKASGAEMSRHSCSSAKRWSLITGATRRNVALNCATISRRSSALFGFAARKDSSSIVRRSFEIRTCSAGS
jgi:hypothetical protein